MSRVVALVTDFGYRDPYVGVMKSVIKSINPLAEIIDLTHGISRHDVHEAAVVLLVSAKYFPRGTVFTCVVDPGVGSERKAIVVETHNYYLVGPDNGCLTLLAQEDGIKRVFDVSSSKFALRDRSYTFHGRDLFAPVAAYLTLGYSPEELGSEISISEIAMLERARPIVRGGVIEARVLYIDVFGNVMTNVERGDLDSCGIRVGDVLNVVVGGRASFYCKFVESFSRVPRGEFACYINSWKYLEIAINMGDAARELDAKRGDFVIIRPRR